MLEHEEEIKRKLEDKFDFMKDKVNVTRVRRLWVEIPREQLTTVVSFAKNELGFDALCTITGLDSGDNLEMIYHLARGGVMLNLKVFTPKSDPVLDTVTGIYEGATMYELEARNLLGVDVKGIPTEIRYPLSDDWPAGQYPLRKDWTREPAESTPQGG